MRGASWDKVEDSGDSGKESCVIELTIEGSIGGGSITQQERPQVGRRGGPRLSPSYN